MAMSWGFARALRRVVARIQARAGCVQAKGRPRHLQAPCVAGPARVARSILHLKVTWIFAHAGRSVGAPTHFRGLRFGCQRCVDRRGAADVQIHCHANGTSSPCRRFPRGTAGPNPGCCSPRVADLGAASARWAGCRQLSLDCETQPQQAGLRRDLRAKEWAGHAVERAPRSGQLSAAGSDASSGGTAKLSPMPSGSEDSSLAPSVSR